MTGEDPDKHGKRAFATLAVAHLMLAGIGGLPIIGDLADLIKMAANFDLDYEIRSMFAERTDSPQLSEALMKGLSSFAPWDFSRSVGQARPLGIQDLWEGKVDRLSAAIGIPVGMIRGGIEAAK